jgi:hypothetical protein
MVQLGDAAALDRAFRMRQLTAKYSLDENFRKLVDAVEVALHHGTYNTHDIREAVHLAIKHHDMRVPVHKEIYCVEVSKGTSATGRGIGTTNEPPHRRDRHGCIV